jgi:hypothetical protein
VTGIPGLTRCLCLPTSLGVLPHATSPTYFAGSTWGLSTNDVDGFNSWLRALALLHNTPAPTNINQHANRNQYTHPSHSRRCPTPTDTPTPGPHHSSRHANPTGFYNRHANCHPQLLRQQPLPITTGLILRRFRVGLSSWSFSD